MRMLYEHCPDDGGKGDQLQQIGKWGRELSSFNPCPTALPPKASLTETRAVANMRSHVKAGQRLCSNRGLEVQQRPENFQKTAGWRHAERGAGALSQREGVTGNREGGWEKQVKGQRVGGGSGSCPH